MSMRMLIDARHREETRVAVVQGNRIEEFDFESAEHEQLKGNIYLAKVTRVEPSLQAAFVEYGGNRHGFLAFSEIHPDYYQIPKADRDRLLAEEAAAAAEEAALREQEEEEEGEPADILRGEAADEDGSDFIEVDTDTSIDTLNADGNGDGREGDGEGYEDGYADAPDAANDDEDGETDSGAADDTDGAGDSRRDRSRRGRGRRDRGTRGQPKASDEAREKRFNIRRRYKIQDVIHRRQVMLVQVVKEERGNKGAALTTYLSLAGRYCVLMPNTSHGGGISRKISSAADRKRLKSIVSDLQLPATMGCIIRTAGLQRTRTEIKRDFDYLARLWDEIRENTLKGTAPQLIHSDSNLVKRAIRDIYNREIDEVLVEGEAGYKAAKDFMKLLMPSHARRVQHYADPVPLFQRFGVEDQLSAMYNPVVQLKSGGYIVINPTEALVSIDINSGRSTKEHNIEQTALATNLEAAREIARQLRLRDMAGLVVIDFIDMEHHSNSRKVEKAMKEALKNDRARIQVGRISSFGLMEMSRQRLRTGVLEASTRQCPHCEGTGLVRTASSAALSALRLIEEEAARGRGSQILLSASQEAAVYVLNHKRYELAEIEERYGVRVAVLPNAEAEGAKMSVAASGPRPEKQVSYAPIVEEEPDSLIDEEDDFIDEEDAAEARETRDERPREPRREREGAEGEDDRPRRKRRRRGRRGGRGRREDEGNLGEAGEGFANEAGGEGDMDGVTGAPPLEGMDAAIAEAAEAPADAAADEAEAKPARRSRRRKTAADPGTDGAVGDIGAANAPGSDASAADAPVADALDAAEEAVPEAPKPRGRRKKADAEAPAAEEPTAKPKRRSRAKKTDAEVAPAEAVPAATEPAAEAAPETKPKRRSRAKKVDSIAEADADSAATLADAPVAANGRDGAMPGSEGPAVVDQQAASEPARPASAGDPAEPPRKGWWQRTFG